MNTLVCVSCRWILLVSAVFCLRLGCAAQENDKSIASSHYAERLAIVQAYERGDSESAKQQIDQLLSRSSSSKLTPLRRLDLMRDVAVLLHAGSKKGLSELATDLRRIPPELSVRADLSEAWSQIGEIDERLLDNFEAAEKSYRNALSSDSSNLRAKAGLERMSRRERLSRQFQGEHERLRAGGL